MSPTHLSPTQLPFSPSRKPPNTPSLHQLVFWLINRLAAAYFPRLLPAPHDESSPRMLLGLGRIGSFDSKFLEVIARIGHGGKVYLEARNPSSYMGSLKETRARDDQFVSIG